MVSEKSLAIIEKMYSALKEQSKATAISGNWEAAEKIQECAMKHCTKS